MIPDAPVLKKKTTDLQTASFERNRRYMELRENKLEKIREKERQEKELQISQSLQRTTTPVKKLPGERIEDRLFNSKKHTDKHRDERPRPPPEAPTRSPLVKTKARHRSSVNVKNDLL